MIGDNSFMCSDLAHPFFYVDADGEVGVHAVDESGYKFEEPLVDPYISRPNVPPLRVNLPNYAMIFKVKS